MDGCFELILFRQDWDQIVDSFISSISSKSSFSHYSSYSYPRIISCFPISYSSTIKSDVYSIGIKPNSFNSNIFVKSSAYGTGISDDRNEDENECAGGPGGGKNGGNLFDNFGDWFWNDNRSSFAHGRFLLYTLLLFFCFSRRPSYKGDLYFILSVFPLFTRGIAAAKVIDKTAIDSGNIERGEEVWEVRGGRRTRLVPTNDDEFTVHRSISTFSSSPEPDSYVFESDHSSSSALTLLSHSRILNPPWLWLRDFIAYLMLPEDFPRSVSTDYVDYCVWRGVQSVASQINSVISTQALLYAVGLGKGQITTAAAVNWIIKDGIGYLSKIALSKYGRHFDVNPKGWRLFADLLENFSYGMEMLTPAFPHLFVFIGATAGAGRSASALIQAATRNCFYSSFAVRRNFAEVIAKGEAQGMASKCLGTLLGVLLAKCIGSSGPLTAMSFCIVTWVHMFCNLNSYRCIQLRTLNSYRASLIFSEYLLSGQVPSVKEVNAEEPLFPNIHIFIQSAPKVEQSDILSFEAMKAAVDIDRRLKFGSKLSEVINNFDDVVSLFDLYRNEGYILAEKMGKYYVIVKEGATQEQMLKSMFQLNYMYWLEKQAGVMSRGVSQDCRDGGRLSASLEYAGREFRHVKCDGASLGWVTDGLMSAPLLNKIVHL